MTAVEKIDGIVEKIKLILDKNQRLEADIVQLKQKLETLEQNNKSLEKDNGEFKKQLQLVKMAKSVDVSSDERTAIKKELKQYIKEIDRCMALLNK